VLNNIQTLEWIVFKYVVITPSLLYSTELKPTMTKSCFHSHVSFTLEATERISMKVGIGMVHTKSYRGNLILVRVSQIELK
jgi:hypothetical protein